MSLHGSGVSMKQDDLFRIEPKNTPESDPSKDLPVTYVQGYLEDLQTRPNFSVEANFMFLPIFSFDKKASDKRSKITHSVPILKNGVVTTSVLSVATSEIIRDGKSINPGLPGAFDMQILFCLMDLWDEQGRNPDGVVRFRLTTICKRLNLSISGRTYADMKFSIKKLAVTKVESVMSFFSQEKAAYMNTIVGILDHPEFISAKTQKGSDDTCQVTLSKYILKNLLNNFTAQINRKIYQALGNGFSQRLLSLFLYRQQVHRDEYVEFELMDLAQILPMSGKLFPSKVKERLQTALNELTEKRVLKHEFIKVSGKNFLRLSSFEEPKDYLVGPERISKFKHMAEFVYGIDPFHYFEIADEMIEKMLSKYAHVIEFSERQYSWFFHVIDVATFMVVKTGYEVKSKNAFILKLLNSEAKELDYPMAFKPLDLCFKEKKSKDDGMKAIVIKDRDEREAEDELFRVALNYSKSLNEYGKNFYLKKVKEVSPLIQGENPVAFEIANLISEDIKAGIDIGQYLSSEKLQVVRKDVKTEGF